MKNNKPFKKQVLIPYNQNKIQINKINEKLKMFFSEKENILPKFFSQTSGKII